MKWTRVELGRRASCVYIDTIMSENTQIGANSGGGFDESQLDAYTAYELYAIKSLIDN
jgi:hypothetical protein